MIQPCTHGNFQSACVECKHGAELASLRRLTDTLREIANDGCGMSQPVNNDPSAPWVTCRDTHPGNKEAWCWCCIARAALEKEGML